MSEEHDKLRGADTGSPEIRRNTTDIFDRFPRNEKVRRYVIFGEAVGRSQGGYGYNDDDVKDFFIKFPTAADFIKFALRYLSNIERANSAATRTAYEVSMQAFIMAMFNEQIPVTGLRTEKEQH